MYRLVLAGVNQAQLFGLLLSDLYTTPLSGHLDYKSGLASLTTHSYLFVWNYVKVRAPGSLVRSCSSATTRDSLYFIQSMPSYGSSLQQTSYASPTLYPFPLPSSTSLCLTQLVRRPAGREPGVLIVSPKGQVRFWDGISQALVAGGDRFIEGTVGSLSDGEEVSSISEIEVSTG